MDARAASVVLSLHCESVDGLFLLPGVIFQSM